MSEDDLILYAVVGFIPLSYAAVIGFSLAGRKHLTPYVVLIGLHGLAALWYWRAQQHLGGSDAAGNGLAAGLTMLVWLAVNIALTLVAWAVFLARRYLLRDGAPGA
jgi:hypothetical protein